MKAVWNDSLTSGNKLIDSQHKELFDHINTFFDSITKEYSHEITVRTLNFLVKYVRYHFNCEEDMMRKTDFEEYKEHREAHRKLVDELMTCYKKLISDGKTEHVMHELSALLQEWFVEHIMAYDVRLVSHMKQYEFE